MSKLSAQHPILLKYENEICRQIASDLPRILLYFQSKRLISPFKVDKFMSNAKISHFTKDPFDNLEKSIELLSTVKTRDTECQILPIVISGLKELNEPDVELVEKLEEELKLATAAKIQKEIDAKGRGDVEEEDTDSGEEEDVDTLPAESIRRENPILTKYQKEIGLRTIYDLEQMLLYYKEKQFINDWRVNSHMYQHYMKDTRSISVRCGELVSIMMCRGDEDSILPVVVKALKKCGHFQLANKLDAAGDVPIKQRAERSKAAKIKQQLEWDTRKLETEELCFKKSEMIRKAVEDRLSIDKLKKDIRMTKLDKVRLEKRLKDENEELQNLVIKHAKKMKISNHQCTRHTICRKH